MAGSDRALGDAGDGSTPYFFLSYARHHRADEADDAQGGDPDRWTLRFFDDLTYEVAELTTPERGARPGFMDREVRVGQEWRRRISEALAACRVFLPLYTPRYFTSLSCASEWYLFQARQSAHEPSSGSRPEAIIPVLWLPIPAAELPPAAQALQFDHRTLGEPYARLGFLQLIRLARYKDEYQLAIHALARQVVQVARAGAPRAARPVDFMALHGRFESAEGLFEAAGELACRAGGRTPLPLALPPGTGGLWQPPSSTGSLADSAGTFPTTGVERGYPTGRPELTGPIPYPTAGSVEPVGRSNTDPALRSTASSIVASNTGPAAWPATRPTANPVELGPIASSLAESNTGSAVGPVTRPTASPLEGAAALSTALPAGLSTIRAEDAVAAYLRTAQAKLVEWFTSRPAQVSSVDFDEFYFREVHPAAKAALLRQLTPHAPAGPFPRPPRLRVLPVAEPPPPGAPHVP
ncbi:MAG: TIR-like protein FxsC [Catenulispora sp.]